MQLLALIHIFMGSVALLAGGAAMLFRKGSRRHRGAGNVFFGSMLLMSATGAYMAYHEPDMRSVVAGCLTFYLVATGWAAAIRKPNTSGAFELLAMSVAFAIAAAGFIFGMEAVNSETGLKDGSSPPVYFVFGAIALLAAVLDARMIFRGGVSGVSRLTRHLWRMCFALLLATAALFLGQPLVFPEPVRGTLLLFVPVVAVLGLMVFWLIRVRLGGNRKIPLDPGSGLQQEQAV